jgi:Protein of unknown function (DUF3300)
MGARRRPSYPPVSLRRLLKIWRKMHIFQGLVAVVCAALLAPGEWVISARAAQTTTAQTAAAPEAAVKLSGDQLDSLVAPIALYPDPLLSQVLVAATYPLEIVQLQQWLEKNKDLKDQALADAVKKQDWDPSIQAMASLPDVVKRLADDIKWTADLGNAFLAQQSDVMDAVQRMRKKAQEKGNLKTSEQQKVETKVVETKEVIVIEQADPQVIYVPSYNPTVVYGPPIYPYPPIYYPPPGYYAAGMAISFGIGIAMGAFWGGGWGWGCGWGHNDININVHNNFHQNNINRGGNRVNPQGGRGGNTWQHNPQHRGGAPYGDRATANKFGGTARGDSMSTRQASARQQQGRTGSGRQSGSMDRGGSGGGDRVGNRSVSSSGRSGNSGAFGGASSGVSGRSARSSSSRGSSSFGGSRGGGRRR